MKRILFVDDDPLILQGMRRTLHSMRGEWEMRFAKSPIVLPPGCCTTLGCWFWWPIRAIIGQAFPRGSGAEALAVLAQESIDVIVSDEQMPGMLGKG